MPDVAVTYDGADDVKISERSDSRANLVTGSAITFVRETEQKYHVTLLVSSVLIASLLVALVTTTAILVTRDDHQVQYLNEGIPSCNHGNEGGRRCVQPQENVSSAGCGCTLFLHKQFYRGELVTMETTTLSVEGQDSRETVLPILTTPDFPGQRHIMLMRREDGSEDFTNTKYWIQYRLGFGDMCGEMWLGNENMFYLTNNGSRYTLRIDMQDIYGSRGWAEYEDFRIEHEDQQYRLHLGNYSGDIGNSLKIHDDQMFTTPDRDNVIDYYTNCAVLHKGSWWYNNDDCFEVKLTGRYYKYYPGDEDWVDVEGSGIHWWTFSTYDISLQYVDMKLRVKSQNE